MAYVAGWSMGGYLPDMEPVTFDNYDDASAFILGELDLIVDQLADPDDEHIVIDRGRFANERSVNYHFLNGYWYWIEKE